jgi:2-methylisocitrate lyase-like PEP mutase family enzyme
MVTLTERRAEFRRLIESGETILVPGAPNALTARLIADVGFEACYLTGAGLTNTYLGMPDIGLISAQEVATHISTMSSVVDTPIIADGDTGFGNAINTWHTVRMYERAGAFAIQLEDQTFPKRCGHFEGKSTVQPEEMTAKIKAAIEARTDPNFLIIARTDARATEGLEEAIRRVNMYREAGADILFVEAPHSEDEIRQIATGADGPKVLNIVEGGKTPALSLEKASELGISIVLYANLPLVVHTQAVSNMLKFMKENGHANGGPDRMSFTERQQLVRKDFFDELGKRYET